MNFVLLTTNLAGGGAEKALSKIGTGLANRGHRVEFVVIEDSGLYPPPTGCNFHILERTAGHGWFAKRYLAFRLRRLLRDLDYDLLVSTLPFADEIAAMARIPRHVCRIANTLSAEINRLPLSKGQRRLKRYRRLYGSRPLVAVSNGVASDLKENFGAIATVISNPFDIDAIRRLASEPSNRPSEPYLLHVGRFVPQKRHDLLFDAFRRLNTPCRLVLLTPPNEDLSRLIEQFPSSRRPVVADFQANPYPWMAGAELLALSSDHEGLPNVLIEALACGTRIVSTDCPSGPREILGDELAQYLVPCNDAEALANAMRMALSMPRPSDEIVAKILAPYRANHALDAWEALAREAG